MLGYSQNDRGTFSSIFKCISWARFSKNDYSRL